MKTGARKYSLTYRIYRRIRYLRYLRKHRNRIRRQAKYEEKQAELERRKLLKEQARTDRLSDRQKLKMEKAESKKAAKEIRKEYEKGLVENAELDTRRLEEYNANERKEKEFQRYRRKKLIRFYRKTCWKSTLKTICILNPLNIPKLISYAIRNRQTTRAFLIITFQSTLLFVAAYLMMFLFARPPSDPNQWYYGKDRSHIYYHLHRSPPKSQYPDSMIE